MTKLFKFAAIGGLCLTTSCTALGGMSASTIALVDQVQAGAIKVCGFMPVIEDVGAILAGPVAMGVDAVVNALCAAIPPAPISAARAGAPVSRAGQSISVIVNGKVVNGVLTR